MSTRDELIDALGREEHAPMEDHDPRDGSCRSCPWPVHMLGQEVIADALIAEGWRKKPSEAEVIAVLDDDMILDVGELSPVLLMEQTARAILALMDRGQ